MIEPKKKYQDALVVLNEYYGRLMDALAEEILANKDDFLEFGAAERIIETYS